MTLGDERSNARDRPSSATVKTLIKLHEFDHQRAWTRYCNAVVRGAAIGFCLRGGLHLLKFLFALVLRRKRSSRSQSLSEVFQDTLRYTGFLGAFAGVFVSVDEGLAAVFGPERCSFSFVSLQSICTCGAHAFLWGTCMSSDTFHVIPRTKRWRAFVAGALAGPAILLTGYALTHAHKVALLQIRACGDKASSYMLERSCRQTVASSCVSDCSCTQAEDQA